MRLFDFGVELDLNIKKGNKTVKRINSKNSNRLGKQTVVFKNEPKIMGKHALVSSKEKKGPFGEYFSDILQDPKYEENTFEKAETKMFTHALTYALMDANINSSDVDILFSGDLLSQIISSSFSARLFDIPYLGIYGACSTMAEGLIFGAMLIDGGFAEITACVTGSHYATAERQYRGPLELGGQKQKYSQHTVTASAATILGIVKDGIKITKATIGKVEDYGIIDVANMGAAMAPSAMGTLSQFFKDTQTNPDDYDLIATGDLGKLGSDLLRKMMNEKGYKLGKNYMDCGASIYDYSQHTSEGGSGCGCGAAILNTYIINKMESGTYKKVIFAATGALMSTIASQQGESIPSVTHLVLLES